MKMLELFAVQRQIIGICPRSQQFFRLSDCRIIQKHSRNDWLGKLNADQLRIERAQERLSEREYKIRERAREQGRRQATLMARKVDRIFAPRKIQPDDVRPILSPVDFIAFKGMSTNNIKGISLLDRMTKVDRGIQRSTEKCVERERYEWLTLRISDNGEIKTE